MRNIFRARTVWFGIGLGLFLWLAAPIQGYAEKPIMVYVDNEPIALDTNPIIENGSTLVQFRPLFENFDFQIKWNGDEHKITGSTTGLSIELTIGSKHAQINGDPVILDVAPELVDGNTFVPLRFIGEASDRQVYWDGDNREVEISGTLISGIRDHFHKYLKEMNGKLPLPDKDGVFRLRDKDGALFYEGQMWNGRIQGVGKYYLDGELLYDGDWQSFTMQGNGTMKLKDTGAEYVGEFRKGKYDGKGTLTEYGIKYVGDFKNGLREGTGKLYDKKDKLIYEGTFQNDQPTKSFQEYETSKRHALHTWKSFKTKYFEVYYYEQEAVIEQSSKKFDDIYDSVTADFKHNAEARQSNGLIPVYYLNKQDFIKDLEITDSFVGMWFYKTMYMNLSLASEYASEMNTTFRHELIHAVTIDSKESLLSGVTGWLAEGVATYNESMEADKISNERYEKYLRSAVKSGSLKTWEELEGSSEDWGTYSLDLGYSEAWSIWGYLASTYGEQKINDLFYKDKNLTAALKELTGKSMEDLEKQWLAYIEKKYK
jgi:hypothetical protein